MMRIAISQRVDVIPDYGERRDCLDQQWSVLLETMGLDAVPVPNDLKRTLSWIERQQVSGVILSGGNDLAELSDARNPAIERDATERILLQWARSNNIPVLGVCRGMQMMNHFLGGTLCDLEAHVATRHELLVSSDDVLFRHHREVNSFHNRGMMSGDLAEGLEVRARASADNSVEAFTHSTLPWVGIMWHPEREFPFHNNDISLMDSIFRSA